MILPRCARDSLLFLPYLSSARTHACVRAYICTRELASACERGPLVRRESVQRFGREGRGRGRGEEGEEWKRLRRRSEVTRTLDEADATPTERHPRENPSPRSPRLLHLFSLASSPPSSSSSSPRTSSSFLFPPFARAFFCLFFRSLRSCVHETRRSPREDFIFEPDCTVTCQILGVSTGILYVYFDILQNSCVFIFITSIHIYINISLESQFGTY